MSPSTFQDLSPVTLFSNPSFSYLSSSSIFFYNYPFSHGVFVYWHSSTSSISLLFCWMALSRVTVWLAVEGSSPSLLRSLSLLLVPLWSLSLLWFLSFWQTCKREEKTKQKNKQDKSWTVVIRQLAKNMGANTDDDWAANDQKMTKRKVPHANL